MDESINRKESEYISRKYEVSSTPNISTSNSHRELLNYIDSSSNVSSSNSDKDIEDKQDPYCDTDFKDEQSFIISTN